MPKQKKKKSGALQTLNDDKSAMDFQDIEHMDEDAILKMKEKLFAENPQLKKAFAGLERIGQTRTTQAQNSFEVFRNRRGKVTEGLLNQFPDSPTAKITMKALQHYTHGLYILLCYNKPRVLYSSDCDHLQPGFHHYIEGYMIAQYMSQQFPLPPNIDTLVEDYLKLRPHDTLVDYFRVNIVVNMRAKDKPDYERCKDVIRAFELFANKLLPYKGVETERRLLANTYYMLAAHYTSTDQDVRALDAFEKCFELDPTNLEALYGIAYQYTEKDPEKALKLANEYLDIAPKCDEKYPNTLYLIGYVYAVHFKNLKIAKEYFKRGQKAEKYQLPFNPPTECSTKSLLEAVIPLADIKKVPEKEMPEKLKEIDFLDLD